jgi:hypothetical protein
MRVKIQFIDGHWDEFGCDKWALNYRGSSNVSGYFPIEPYFQLENGEEVVGLFPARNVLQFLPIST